MHRVRVHRSDDLVKTSEFISHLLQRRYRDEIRAVLFIASESDWIAAPHPLIDIRHRVSFVTGPADNRTLIETEPKLFRVACLTGIKTGDDVLILFNNEKIYGLILIMIGKELGHPFLKTSYIDRQVLAYPGRFRIDRLS